MHPSLVRRTFWAADAVYSRTVVRVRAPRWWERTWRWEVADAAKGHLYAAGVAGSEIAAFDAAHEAAEEVRAWRG